ncbi:hypothetical protein [Pseudogulbenkiania ferrooxidans]|uniref:SnoaL-like domain-containing protein n=1 Tax=Pseudogulbenkiania ferrooxidans EGD-HP2 TaxID=1388764 RepID=A0ABP2XMG5_9NEIS|nr:hypothetical protein [Pseudogulbenkiania ferrooxidans]ERE07211.1 hypothetical protein O166_06540 [Pseudogulbenkiania ferrooxidans EGD-HP2]
MTWAAEQTAAVLQLAEEFGATATWQPGNGAAAVLDQPVLFDSPTHALGIDAPGGGGLNSRFDYTDYLMTTAASVFPGLKSSVDSGGEEFVTLYEFGQETGRFFVRTVRYVGDGRLIEARLSMEKQHVGSDRGQLDPALARLFAG